MNKNSKEVKGCETCEYRGRCYFPSTAADARRNNTCGFEKGEFKHYKPKQK